MDRPTVTASCGELGRWRVLAEVTARGLEAPAHDDVRGRLAAALAALFDTNALVLGGHGDDDAVVARTADGAGRAAVSAAALALGRAAMNADRVLRDDTPDGKTVLAAPLQRQGTTVGAIAVSGGGLGTLEDIEVLECFAAHAARALMESERRYATSEMAAGIAHHLNNLMTVALGNVQLMLRQPVAEPAARSLGAIERAVLDAADVVRRLAASTGRPLVGTHVTLDLSSLIDATLSASRPRWRDEQSVRFECGDVPPILADEAEIRELLLNLVLNALDAVAGGGDIVVRTWADAGRVLFSVSDTGDGMTPEVRRRATEPFFTTRGPARQGLGLSVAAAIVKRHRGTLAMRSSVGEGTTVTVDLPAGDPPTVAFREAAEASVHGLRVLVVDDDDPVRTTIAELVAASGHEAVEVASGHEALAQLEAANGTFDLVLTDLGMPGLTGWDVIERIKARWPGLPVILVTGWGEQLRGGTTRRAPDAMLAKPLTERRLRDVIAGVVA